MENQLFDIAVIGGGCSGFQLLHQLSLQSGWQDKKVALITDENPKQRSWCFWRKGEHPLQHLVHKSWSNITFKSAHFSKTENILPYQYHYISGEAFFDYFTKEFTPKQPNISAINGTIQSINKNNTGFYLHSEDAKWKAEHVFSSIIPQNSGEARFHLWQHFQGWFIKTEEAIFDDSTVILMDFSIPQSNDVRFVYVLPFSPHEALVEMTVFSPQVYADSVYAAVLQTYIKDNYPNSKYTIESTEKGKIPMTDAPFSRFGTEGEVLIGTAAGMVKSSTGYAFKRIGQDSARIAKDFEAKKTFSWRPSRRRFRFYDRLLLGTLTEEPLKGSVIFGLLFQKMPMRTVLRFLDEETNLWEELTLFSKLPFLPFLKQIARQWKK